MAPGNVPVYGGTMPDMGSTRPSEDFGNAAIDLLLALLIAEKGNRRPIPARKLNLYVSSLAERQRFAARVRVYLYGASAHPLYRWRVDYNADSLIFVATPLPE